MELMIMMKHEFGSESHYKSLRDRCAPVRVSKHTEERLALSQQIKSIVAIRKIYLTSFKCTEAKYISAKAHIWSKLHMLY